MKKFLCLALMSSLFFACNNQKADDAKTTATVDSVAAAPAKPQPAEFADPKYIEIGKKNLAALSAGDVDGYMSSFADNAVYLWNNGDSLNGKAAIAAYWKKRRTEVIDSLNFSDEIWLPVKVNQPQSTEQSGIWLLGWDRVHAKYKTGKSMTQFMHSDMHFDANDKIDRYIQYMDHVPILAATKK